MKFVKTDLPGVVVVVPDVFRDDRGFFFESYHQKKFDEAGINAGFVQDNCSRSVKNTLRGLHFQMKRPQAKLVRVLSGEIYDVVVDLRAGSPTYKKWVGVKLSDLDYHAVYVPEGFAHGFVVVSETADVEYKCTDFYDKSDEGGLIWNDPSIGVVWPCQAPLLSSKDRQWPTIDKLAAQLSKYPAYRA